MDKIIHIMKFKSLSLIPITFLITVILLYISATVVHADLGPSQGIGCSNDFGAFSILLCKGTGKVDLGSIFNNALSKLLGFLTIIAALFFFFQFITAGIAWIGSGGDKNNIEAARNKIMNAILGLVIVAAAYVLVGIIGQFVGINVLNPGKLINVLDLTKPR